MNAEGHLAARLGEALASLRPETIDALRPLYHENLEFQDPIQTLHGLDAFLAMNRRLFARFRELAFDVTTAAGTDRDAFVVWTMRATPKVGPHLAVDGVTHARAADGRVTHQRDYWDLGELVARAIPGGPAALRFMLRPFA